MTFEAFDTVVVPFPFTDRVAAKRRPALVVSSARYFNTPSRHLLLAMITSRGSAPWPLDVAIQDLKGVGLSSASVVRMKLFTLDQRLILRKLGRLAEPDTERVRRSLSLLLGT